MSQYEQLSSDGDYETFLSFQNMATSAEYKFYSYFGDLKHLKYSFQLPIINNVLLKHLKSY